MNFYLLLTLFSVVFFLILGILLRLFLVNVTGVWLWLCMCVFISVHRRGFSYLAKRWFLVPEFRLAMVYCADNSVSRPFKDSINSLSSTFIKGTFKLWTVQKCQLTGRSHEKYNTTYKLSKKLSKKARSMFSFLHTNLRSRPDIAQSPL